jgi:hypothetical protein
MVLTIWVIMTASLTLCPSRRRHPLVPTTLGGPTVHLPSQRILPLVPTTCGVSTLHQSLRGPPLAPTTLDIMTASLTPLPSPRRPLQAPLNLRDLPCSNHRKPFLILTTLGLMMVHQTPPGNPSRTPCILITQATMAVNPTLLLNPRRHPLVPRSLTSCLSHRRVLVLITWNFLPMASFIPLTCLNRLFQGLTSLGSLLSCRRVLVPGILGVGNRR